MIFNRNELWIGLVIGLVLPLVGYALLLTIFEQLEAFGILSPEGFSPTFRQRTLMVIALCLNIIPFNIYQRKRFTQAMRGLVIPTTFYAIAWVIYFGKEIL